ncbi:MAG: GNAT family N-acetyltransferase [Spirochaetia bacterium]|jgi:PhnO protein|nr:GNAT family N-acetyltransferase [Spirochaetia bacterium]
MDKKLKIRACLKEDADEVFKMICHLEGENPVRADFDKVFLSNLDNNSVYYIIAEFNSRIIGFAGMHIQALLHHTGPVAEIQEMFIDPLYRNSGYGEEMLNHLRDIAEAKGCRHFEAACNIVRTKTHSFLGNRGMQSTHYKFTERL